MKKFYKDDEVLYLALRDAMRELKDSILASYDRIYNISDDENDDFYSVSSMLAFAETVAEEMEDNNLFEDELI